MRLLKWLVLLAAVAGVSYGGYAYFWERGEELGYRVKAGKIYRYKMTMSGDGTVMGGPAQIPITLNGASVYRVKILSVAEDGSFKAHWKLERNSMSVQAMGMAQPMPQASGLTATFTSDASGKIKGVPVGDDLSQAGMLASAASSRSFSGYLGMGLDYPKRHIPVGGSWKNSSTIKSPAAMGQDATRVRTRVNSVNRLTAIETKGGRRVGLYQCSFDGATEKDEKNKADMKMKGIQKIHCFLDSGMPADGTMSMTIDMTPKSEGGQQGGAQIRMTTALARLPVK